MVTLYNTQRSLRIRNGPIALWVAVILLLIPVIVFWSVWASYAVNVPKWDDHVLKSFLFNLDRETSISGKIYQLFRQHNEHRIVYDRVITWLDFQLFGKFSYLHLMVVGNLSLLGLIAIFGLALGRSVIPLRDGLTHRSALNLADCLLYLPPVAFLLLNLSQWENMFWGMAALQNFTVILWVFGAIYLLAFTQKIRMALLLAILATLTSGNGLLVWPVGFAMLLLQTILQNPGSRKPLVFWSLCAVIAISLYFVNYLSPPGNPPARGSFIDLISGWFAFSGSAEEAFPIHPVIGNCVLLGGVSLVIVLGICLYILKKSLSHRVLSSFDYFFLGSAAFLVGTGAIVAWTRTGFGINTLITSRYKLYSLLLIALLYTYLVGQLRISTKKWGLRIGLLFSIILMGSSYRTYQDDAIWWRQWLLTHQFNWSYTTNRPVSSIDPQTERLINNSPAFYDSVLPALYKPATGSSRPLSLIQKQAEDFVLSDTTSVTPVAPDAGTYILLRSGKRLYLFQTTPAINQSRKVYIGLAPLFSKGFSGVIPEADLEPATYSIERLVVTPNERIERYPTGQTIVVSRKSKVSRDIQKNW